MKLVVIAVCLLIEFDSEVRAKLFDNDKGLVAHAFRPTLFRVCT